MFPTQFKYLSVHLNDSPESNILAEFEMALRFIEEAIVGGGRVLVHCLQGKSRAPTMACAYIIWKFKLRTEEALEMVREAQPEIDPNIGFVSQLQTLFHSVELERGSGCIPSLPRLDACLVVE